MKLKLVADSEQYFFLIILSLFWITDFLNFHLHLHELISCVIVVFQPFMAECCKKQCKLLIHILDRPFSCAPVEHQCNVKERHVLEQKLTCRPDVFPPLLAGELQLFSFITFLARYSVAA